MKNEKFHPKFRHPLAVKLVLNSRSLDQIAFVTDCIAHRSQAHKEITYNGRKSKSV